MHPQKPTPTLYSDMPTQQSSKTNEVESLFDRILYWKAPATTLERGQKRCVKNTATYTTSTYWFAFFCMFRATRLGMSLRGKMEKLPRDLLIHVRRHCCKKLVKEMQVRLQPVYTANLCRSLEAMGT